jgi:hypothetical protein
LTVSDGTSSSTARVAVSARETPRPTIVRFTANPATITTGGVSTLNWVVENADTVTISGVSGTLAKDSGTVNVNPTQTTNYVITATNSVGQATAVAVVTVNPAGSGNRPIVTSFSANPATILQGSQSTLTWTVTGADTVSIDNGVGTVVPNGSVQVTPAATTTYTLTATNAAGQTIATTQVTVQGRVRIITFTGTPTTTTPGSLVRFAWTTENASQVFLEPGGGQRDLNGTVQLTARPGTTVYTLRAVGPGTNNEATATVTIIAEDVASGPQIVIPLSDFYTAFRNVQLDARSSFDPAGGTLTFEWRSVDGKGEVIAPNQALTPVILGASFFGDFVFEVKVTNSRGQSATRRVTVRLTPIGCGLQNCPVP